MIIKWIYIFLLLSIGGCASYFDSLDPSAAAVRYGCSYTEPNFDKNGDFIAGAYSCPKSTPPSYLKSNGCAWVDSYYRKDGTFVSGYQRCHKLKYDQSNAGSTCHYVTGYYRKNGTYVKGYTRCG